MKHGCWRGGVEAHDAALAAMTALRDRPASRRALLAAERALDVFGRVTAWWTDEQLAALHRKTAEGRV